MCCAVAGSQPPPGYLRYVAEASHHARAHSHIGLYLTRGGVQGIDAEALRRQPPFVALPHAQVRLLDMACEALRVEERARGAVFSQFLFRGAELRWCTCEAPHQCLVLVQ